MSGSSSAVTAELSTATDVQKGSAISAKYTEACVLSISPTSSANIVVSMTATTGSVTPAVGASTKLTAAPTYYGAGIRFNLPTTFRNTLEVKLIFVA